MKINYIELRNYRRFGHLELELPDGITGIIGNNGVGKSTLVESIAWALFGNQKDIVRAGKDSIRRSGTGPNDATSAELEFSYAGEEYVVKREMSGRSMLIDASLTINGKPAATGANEVSDLIERKLGMDYKSFFISVFAKQKDLAALSSMRPNERRDKILRMLGIDRLDDAIEEANRREKSGKEKAKDTREAIVDEDGQPRRPALEKKKVELLRGSDAVTKEVARLKKELESLKREEEGLDKRTADTNARLKDLRTASKKVEAEKASLGARKDDIERIGKALDVAKEAKAAAGKLEPLNKELAELKKKQEKMAALRIAHENLLKRRSELRSMDDEISTTKKEIAKYEEEKKKSADVLDSISKHKEQMERIEKENSSTRDKHAGLKERIKSLKAGADSEEKHLKDIEELGPESTCPTCERPLGEHHSELRKKLASSLEKAKAEIAAQEDARRKIEDELAELAKALEAERKRGDALSKKEIRLQRLEGDLEGANKNLDKLEAKRKKLEEEVKESSVERFDQKELDGLLAEIDRLNEKRDELMEAASIARKIPELTESLSKAKAESEKHEKAIKEIRFDPAELELLEVTSEEIEQKRRSLREKSHQTSGSLVEITKKSEGAAAEIRDAQRELDSLVEAEKKLKGLEEDHAYAARLSELMKSFRTSLVARIIPTLSQTASELLSQLTEGRYNSLTLDDEYNISIEDGGVDYALERFSGGETDLANLCLRLAISRVIAERAGTQGIDLLVLDEIFGSQDASRKRNLMASFNALANQFRQILLITHIEDIKEHLSSVIEVYEDEDGESRAKLSA